MLKQVLPSLAFVAASLLFTSCEKDKVTPPAAAAETPQEQNFDGTFRGVISFYDGVYNSGYYAIAGFGTDYTDEAGVVSLNGRALEPYNDIPYFYSGDSVALDAVPQQFVWTKTETAKYPAVNYTDNQEFAKFQNLNYPTSIKQGENFTISFTTQSSIDSIEVNIIAGAGTLTKVVSGGVRTLTLNTGQFQFGGPSGMGLSIIARNTHTETVKGKRYSFEKQVEYYADIEVNP